MEPGRTIYGMDEDEVRKQKEGVRTVAYYDLRDRETPEIAVALTEQEIDLLGRGMALYARKVQTADALALLLGVDIAGPVADALRRLHFRLAFAAHQVSDHRIPNPEETLLDPVKAEAVNDEEVPSEKDPDPLIESGDQPATIPPWTEVEGGGVAPVDPDRVEVEEGVKT